MTFSFHPDAMKEFLEAVDFYESRELGLGLDFAAEIQVAIRNILAYPTAWPKLSDRVRRCLVNRYPYGVLYGIEGEEVLIVALMHLRRHPDYWKGRI